MKKWSFVVLLVVGSTLLGATVLREPIASAAQNVGATIIGPLDAGGNVAVHEQGTASVNVTNPTVPVHEQATAAVRSANDEVSLRQSLSTVPPPSDGPCNGPSYTVPSGKELVIEYVSGEATDFSGNTLGVTGHWEAQVPGEIPAVLPLVFQKQSPEIWTASEAVHLAVPAGGVVQFFGHIQNRGCLMNVALGGYLQPSS
jgi:hypothetical protein